MGLGKPTRAQLTKWKKAGCADLADIKEENYHGQEGAYLIDFPFHGKKVSMVINFAVGFPAKPPAMNFVTKLWHTGVAEQGGAICTASIEPWNTGSGPQKCIEHVTDLLAHPEK